ncbi:MAG: acetyl-CoA carboxylase biotin carboxyl carrier protein [Planctomycetes bacterium]|nr:acetyl-CoA carboxylase biotin carboxyl carrier protein [Planctomycetota bacterium]
MSDKKDKDLQKIEELLEVMNANDLVEIQISHGDDKIVLKRQQSQQAVMTAVGPAFAPAAAAPATDTAAPTIDDGLVEITSPIVGTFYAQPSPDSAPFVEVGASVGTGTVICIIEAMKVMNEIKAETNGKIAEILVKNGEAVEFGQALFKVKPN